MGYDIIMSAIIRNIVNQAFQLPGIIAADEQADGTDTALALIKLNELLGQLNTDQLFPYSQKIVTYTIPTPKLSYTLGIDTPSTADIADERPCFINRILYQTNSNSSPVNVQQLDLPDLLTRQRALMAIGSPCYFAVNNGYPLVTIHLDCRPQAGSVFQIVYNASIPQVTINDTLAIPPEYNDVLVVGLARKLAVMKQMPAETITQMDVLWKESINRIERSNSRHQIPVLDLSGRYNGNNAYCYNAIGYV